MLIVLCAAIVVLYLIYLPINTRVRGGLDMEAAKGHIAFSVFGVPLFKAEGELEFHSLTDSDLIILHRRSRKKIHISVDKATIKQTIESIKAIDLTLIGNLNIKTICLNLRYGSGDSFKTMLYLGVFRMIFYSLLSALKCNQQVDVQEEFIPEYNMRILKTEFYGIFSLSVGDIIYGFIRGKLKKFRRAIALYAQRRQQRKKIKNAGKGVLSIKQIAMAEVAQENLSPKEREDK